MGSHQPWQAWSFKAEDVVLSQNVELLQMWCHQAWNRLMAGSCKSNNWEEAPRCFLTQFRLLSLHFCTTICLQLALVGEYNVGISKSSNVFTQKASTWKKTSLDYCKEKNYKPTAETCCLKFEEANKLICKTCSLNNHYSLYYNIFIKLKSPFWRFDFYMGKSKCSRHQEHVVKWCGRPPDFVP